jgi:hypothetical protein
MISIGIDTSSLNDTFALDQSDIDALMDFAVKEITARFASEWEKQAIESLHSARNEYISHLIVVDEGPGRGAVVLSGWLPNAIEQGASGFDMKEGMLNGPNAKTSKSGNRYNRVPFSFGTPGALQENFSTILPTDIYQIVKKQPAGQPLQKENIPQSFREPQKKSIQLPKSKAFVTYEHKSSIYEGVTKRKDAATGQSTYGSFRTVSDNSDGASWIHPGFDAANLAEKALDAFDVPSETGRIIDQWLSNL